MQSGLKVIFNENLPDYELSFCRSHDELTLLQLRRAVLVVGYLRRDCAPRAVCERYYSLMTQYRDIHWVFMVSDSLYPLAVELLIRPESSLISESEPVNRLIEVICAGSRAAEQISRTLFAGMRTAISQATTLRRCSLFQSVKFCAFWRRGGNKPDRRAVEKE